MTRNLTLAWSIVLFVWIGDCGQAPVTIEPKAPIAPISIAGDIKSIDVCAAVPTQDIEAVMGRKLAKPPQAFEYYDTEGTKGCWYEAAKDSKGSAYFSYVVFTPVDVYKNQPLYRNTAVEGFGQSAYFNNGADARQLWVKLNDRVAFVVAFGDEPREEGAKAIAKLVLQAVK